MPEKILLVDDDINKPTALAAFLRTEGYQVAAACDGSEAAQLLKKDDFDLVLSYVVMPGMDGLQLLDFTHSLSSPMPVLFMSAPGSGSINRTETIERGATDLVRKPFDPYQLLLKLKLLLYSGRLRELAIL
jgi:DNA-binding response OmpR family regulator